jgi:microcystin-dependent protein
MKRTLLSLLVLLALSSSLYASPYVPPKTYAPLDPVLSSDRNLENSRIAAAINNIDPATQINDSSITSAQIAPGGISIDNLSGTIAFTILGTVTAYAGDTQTAAMTSAGWFLCDGRTVSSSTLGSAYSAAYALLGTRFGPSTASTLYIPDLRSRVIVGYNPAIIAADAGDTNDTRSIRTVGDTGGVQRLTVNEMPSHTHPIVLGNGIGTVWPQSSPTTASGTGSTESTGNSKIDGNMQPFIVLHQIIYLGRP